MNEELQSTNEELETMNDELRERTDETLHANSFLGSVLSGIQQGVVVVDQRAAASSRGASRATELWGLRDDEVEGEHFLDLDIGIPVQRLRDPIRSVLAGDGGRRSRARGPRPARQAGARPDRGRPAREPAGRGRDLRRDPARLGGTNRLTAGSICVSRGY